MSDPVEALIRKLNYHESIIEKLLSIDYCSNGTNGVIGMLERKMIRLEEMVLQIPFDNDPFHQELFEEWTDTIVGLWDRLLLIVSVVDVKKDCIKIERQLAIGQGGDVAVVSGASNNKRSGGGKRNGPRVKQIMAPEVVATTTAAVSSSTTSSQVSNGTGKRNPSVSLVIRKVSGEQKTITESTEELSKAKRQQRQTARNFRRRTNDADPNTPNASKNSESTIDLTATDDEPPITKESLIAQFEASFTELEPAEVMDDIEEMQALLIELSKAVRKMSQFRDDTELQIQLLSYLLPKLPTDAVDRFQARTEATQECTLHLLKTCLIDELTEYYDELKKTAGGDDVLCYYCKTQGHKTFQCPAAKTMICFRCFKNGHKSTDCGKRCFRCKRFGHFSKACPKNGVSVE